MITKITILNTRALSWEINPNKSLEDILKQAEKEFRENAEFFDKAKSLMSFLNYAKDIPVQKAIVAIFGPNTYSLNTQTKKRRIYHVIGGLYIHEEDK